MLELKVRSAVNSVKQLHINLARMNSYSANADADKMDILAQKTKELNAYLDDLESSYKELKS
jgi:outer membrane murein-binding lipoprotein Lpp